MINTSGVIQCFFCLRMRGPARSNRADTIVGGFACCIEHMHMPMQPQTFPMNAPTSQRIEIKREKSSGG